MLRGEVPRLFPKEEGFIFNRARTLMEGEDIVVLTSGICTEEAMRVLPTVQGRGVSVAHLHISTHKPFDDPTVLNALKRAKKGIFTLENHTIIGGLGSAVAEMMATNGIGVPLTRLGLQDTYAHGASQKFLMKEYGLDARALVQAIEARLGASLEIHDDEITEGHTSAVHSSAKVEAL